MLTRAGAAFDAEGALVNEDTAVPACRLSGWLRRLRRAQPPLRFRRARRPGRARCRRSAAGAGENCRRCGRVHRLKSRARRRSESRTRRRRLPEQEIRDALLAGRADHEVGIGQAVGVERGFEHVSAICRRGKRAVGDGLARAAHGAGHLVTAAVVDGDREAQPWQARVRASSSCHQLPAAAAAPGGAGRGTARGRRGAPGPPSCCGCGCGRSPSARRSRRAGGASSR